MTSLLEKLNQGNPYVIALAMGQKGVEKKFTKGEVLGRKALRFGSFLVDLGTKPLQDQRVAVAMLLLGLGLGVVFPPAAFLGPLMQWYGGGATALHFLTGIYRNILMGSGPLKAVGKTIQEKWLFFPAVFKYLPRAMDLADPDGRPIPLERAVNAAFTYANPDLQYDLHKPRGLISMLKKS